MSQHTSGNLKTIAILIPAIILIKLIDALPWWSFIIPVLSLGIATGVMQWRVSGFLIGFLCGFFIWLGGNLYFHFAYNGQLLEKIGTAPKIIVLLVSGLVGGLLTGLALYTGRSIAINKKAALQL
jgi:hypothetical protein